MVGVVTDSACDLPAGLLSRYGVTAVPITVVVGDELYDDWRALDPPTLYGWMREQGVAVETRPPEVSRFTRAYRELLERHERIVSVHVGASLSATLERAGEAAQQLGAAGRVTLIDSGAVSAAQASVVLEVALAARAGARPPDLEAVAAHVRDGALTLIAPGVAPDAALGRPGAGRRARLLALSGGRLTTAGRVRREEVVPRMLERLSDRFRGAPVRLALGVATTDAGERLVAQRLVEESGLEVAHARVQLIGGGLAARFGPGTLLLSAYPEAGSVPLGPPRAGRLTRVG